jgi:hypothetical protein
MSSQKHYSQSVCNPRWSPLRSSHKQKSRENFYKSIPKKNLKLVPKDHGAMPHMHMPHKRICVHYITKLKDGIYKFN